MTVFYVYDQCWQDNMDLASIRRIQHYGECSILRGLMFDDNGDMVMYLALTYTQSLSAAWQEMWNIEFGHLLLDDQLVSKILDLDRFHTLHM